MYEIVRFRHKGENELVAIVDTLEEAQEHCQQEWSHGDGWFDGYRKVEDDGKEETSSDD